MSSKTKIVVLHMKELIYTAIFAVLGILLILLLIYMFAPGKESKTQETMKYVAGVYTSSIIFNDKTIDVEVMVDEQKIQSISLVNLDETVTAMYPLMEPALDNLKEQIYDSQSTDALSYSDRKSVV